MTELRAKARKAGVYLRVLKNTLATTCAVDRQPFCGLSQHMKGPPRLRHLARSGRPTRQGVERVSPKRTRKLVIRAGRHAETSVFPPRKVHRARAWMPVSARAAREAGGDDAGADPSSTVGAQR